LSRIKAVVGAMVVPFVWVSADPVSLIAGFGGIDKGGSARLTLSESSDRKKEGKARGK
jgi:hypothetical protein